MTRRRTRHDVAFPDLPLRRVEPCQEEANAVLAVVPAQVCQLMQLYLAGA